MPSRPPVIAVIPNYNMAASLQKLLPQVLAQNYDHVYVLDDASTDHSREVTRQFAPKVSLVEGKINLGGGGNRNRILEVHKDECIIHFLDADTRLETDSVPDKARQFMQAPNIGFIGGLVKEKTGKQTLWNFGPALSLHSTLTAYVHLWFGNIQAEQPFWRRYIRYAVRPLSGEWPDVGAAPTRRPTYWVVEANFFIKRSTFEKLGGFDPSIREHDIHELAWQAYHAGLINYFDPSVAVTHLAIKVRNYNRWLALHKAARHHIRKHGGRRQWFFPEGHFKPRYNS